jgi:hypothetical protein
MEIFDRVRLILRGHFLCEPQLETCREMMTQSTLFAARVVVSKGQERPFSAGVNVPDGATAFRSEEEIARQVGLQLIRQLDRMISSGQVHAVGTIIIAEELE